jgi:hypothetical protein
MPNQTQYGFVGLQDLFNQRVAAVGAERIYDAVEATAAEYTRVMNEILSTFSERTTVALEQVELPGTGTLQPVDEWGNPQPVLPGPSYQTGYPIQGGATAWGNNRVTRELITVEEANRFTLDALQRDANWVTRHALAALFTNTTYLFNDKVGANGSRGLGDITIQPLANGDGVLYPKRGVQVSATDTHYLAQAAAIADANNPFPAIRQELVEHPTNAAPYVAYVADSLVDPIGGLTEFVEANDPDIRYGVGGDTLPETTAEILGPGDEVLGKTKSSNMWIVQWSFLPAGYMVVVAQGGMGGPVLKMREYPAPALQGFFPENHSPDGNRQEFRMIRYAGFGAHNRIRALVMRVGSGTYAIPTGYTAPLAV